MYNINATKRVAEIELKEGLEGNRSWHHRFRHSAYIFVGGLDSRLTEGDVVIMFSQFGEVVDIHMKRDQATGKSKGHAYLCYEDQRSTILAVDNMNGYQLLKRTLRVDHSDFKAPKILDEDDKDEHGDPKLKEYKASGAEGAGHEVYNVLSSQRKLSEVQEQKSNKQAKPAALQDEDEAWAKAFDEGLKKMKEGKAKKEKGKSGKYKKELKEIKRMKKEAKMLKEKMKKAKEAAKLAKARKKSDEKESKKEGKKDSKKEVKEESTKESKKEVKKEDKKEGKRKREEEEEDDDDDEDDEESSSSNDDPSAGSDSGDS